MFRRVLFVCLSLVSTCVGENAANAVTWNDGGPDKLWGTAANWQFQNDPNGNDVTIGNHVDSRDDTTLLDDNYVINSLTLNNGADVVTSPDGGTTSYSLRVDGLVNINSLGNNSQTQTILTLYDAPSVTPLLQRPSLRAEELFIGFETLVQLDSISDATTDLAILEVTNGRLRVDSGPQGGIAGNGEIRLRSSVGSTPTVLMTNDGAITAGYINGPTFGAPPATTLKITADDPGARFDLDGLGGGVLQVNGNATLDIDVQPGSSGPNVPSSFGGEMNLATGSTIDFAHAWKFENGLMNISTPSFVFVPGQDPNPGPAARIVGASWEMGGGLIDIGNSWDTLQLESPLVAYDGVINNSGTIVFDANASFQPAVGFNMNGGNSALVVNASVNIATPDFNLDGAGGAGNVTTINPGGFLDLELGAGADEGFDHTINLNSGQFSVSTVDNTWGITQNGTINSTGSSIIMGETFEVQGDINAAPNSSLHINAPTAYKPTASVVIPTGSTVSHGTASFDGGSYTGTGVFKKGEATILKNTTWDVATVDIDDGHTTINAGATLVVNADSIDDAADGIDSSISIKNAGAITFNLSGGAPVVVDSDGSISYTGGGPTHTFLSGSDVVMNGTMFVNGDARSAARLDIGGEVAITGNGFNEPFRLGGGTLTNPNTLQGGTITGISDGPAAPGLLSADDGTALHGHGDIFVDVEFIGNSNLIAENGGLFLWEVLLDVGTLGTSGPGAGLRVQVPWNTNVTDQVLLQGGILGGSTVTNDGVNGITGHGEVISRVVNNTRIGASGGTMVYSFFDNDWDGTSGNGQIVADNGDIELRGQVNSGFTGAIQIDSGRQLYVDGFSLNPSAGSQVILTESTYRASHATVFGGTTTVNAGNDSVFQMDTSGSFANGSTVQLAGNLQLVSPDFQIQDNVVFTGAAAIINTAGSKLDLAANAAVDVLLENEGQLTLGGTGTVGQATGLDFEQKISGILEIDLGGVSTADFDAMRLGGVALLDGAIDLSLTASFTPELGDTFDILSAIGGVTGTFDSIFQPDSMPAGLMFDVNYLGSLVQLEVVEIGPFTADFDNDGDVDSDDLSKWQNAFGGTGADANGDGDSDGADYLAWQQQFGSGVAQEAAASAVPEPSSVALLCLALFAGACTRQSK